VKALNSSRQDGNPTSMGRALTSSRQDGNATSTRRALVPNLTTAEAPPWRHGDRTVFRTTARVAEGLARGFERWVLCRGNRVAYLRRQGMRIGDFTTILSDPPNFGTEPWLIEIGSHCAIAAGAVFITHDGSSRVFRRSLEGSSDFGNGFGPIRVRDNSFVGLRATLLPGVTIGPDSIVGTGSVVNRDGPPGTVAAGVPARVVCTLDEYVEKYQARMIRGLSSDRRELRRQLTRHFWGEER
jgi:acetyltransferase-like isoleucine patch superfamily enzyme